MSIDQDQLRSALNINDSQVIIDKTILDSPSIKHLVESYYANSRIVIQDAQPGPDDGDGRVVIIGTALFLNTRTTVIATFWIGGGGDVVATLKHELPSSWNFSQCFPKLPDMVDFRNPDATPVPYLDVLALSNASFVATTDDGWDGELKVQLKKGLNFVSKLTLNGVLGAVEIVLGHDTKLTLSGSIVLPEAGQDPPPLEPGAVLDDDDQPLPGINLRVELTDNFTLGQVGLVDPYLRFYCPLDVDWLPKLYTPVMVLGGTLHITDKIKPQVSALLALGGGTLTIMAKDVVSLEQLTDATNLAGADDLQSYLPQELQDLGDKLGNLSIESMAVSVGSDNGSPIVNFVYFTIGMSNLNWQVVQNYLEIKDVNAAFAINNPFGSQRSIYTKLSFVFTICGVGVTLSAAHAIGEIGWQFEGRTDPGQAIPIGDLIKDLGDKFGAFEAPSPIADLTVENLEIKFNTHRKDFVFTGEVKFPVDGQELDMILTIEIKHQLDGTPNGSFTKQFSGRITIDGLEFIVLFENKPGATTFIAAYNNPLGRRIKVQDLVKKVSTDIGEYVPPGLEFTLKDALLAYQSKQVGALTEKKYLFGIDIDGGLNLSDLKLPDLPLVGPLFPPEQTLKLSFQLLAAKKTKTKTAPSNTQPEGSQTAITVFDSAEVTGFNSLLPYAKLPNKEITEGLGLSTILQVGTERKTLSLPVGVGNTTAQTGAPNTGPVSVSSPGNLSSPVTTTTPSTTNIQSADGTQWISLQKNFGPVRLERIGLAYKNGNITGLLDAALITGGLTISLSGLSFTSHLEKLDPKFDLHGLGIEYRSGGLEIGGAFLKQKVKTKDGKEYTGFGGLATIRTEKLALSAIGSYAKVNDHPSLFIYAVMDYPIGGPAFFFVTGLAAGFGYNRTLVMPTIDKLREFPLVQEATRDDGPQKLPTDQAGQQQTLSTQLRKLESYIPPAVGQNFLAIGIKFTSFKIIDSFALLTVKFGEKLEFDLLGLSTLKSPPDSPTPIAEAQLALRATFIPEDGFLGVQAKLTPNSYIFSKACQLSGEFAFFSWFKDSADGKIKGGDFVLTLGGYHPLFKVPAHYPKVDRLTINWQLSKPEDPYQLSIKGNAYFALTPHAFMAGGRLEALWQMGAFRAWFIANADFLINWQPYHYDARLYVNIGASYTFELFGRHTVTVDLGADLHIWGPEFSGTATIDARLFKVTIEFGDKTPPKLEPIGWEKSNRLPGFKDSFLPAKDQICSVAVQGGLVRQIEDSDGSQRWIINPKDLVLVTNSVIPSARDGNKISIGPMGRDTNVSSTHKVTIQRDNKVVTSEFTLTEISKSVPAAMWGKPQMDGKYLKPPSVNPEKALVENTLAGFEIRPAESPKPGTTKSIDKDKFSYDKTDVKNAYRWENPLAGNLQGEKAWAQAEEDLKSSRIHKQREDLSVAMGFPAATLDFSEPLLKDDGIAKMISK